MISFTCSCGHKYDVSEKYAGKKVKCKHCNSILRVPLSQSIEEGFSPPQHKPTEVTTEYQSNKSFWVAIILVFMVIGIGFGSVIYFQFNKSKARKAIVSLCDSLVRQAESFVEQEQYEDALKNLGEARDAILNSKNDSPEITILLQQIDEQFQKVKSDNFAYLNRPDLENIQIKAISLFKNADFSGSSKEYSKIINFIKNNQKQKDSHFSSLYTHCQKTC